MSERDEFKEASMQEEEVLEQSTCWKGKYLRKPACQKKKCPSKAARQKGKYLRKLACRKRKCLSSQYVRRRIQGSHHTGRGSA